MAQDRIPQGRTAARHGGRGGGRRPPPRGKGSRSKGEETKVRRNRKNSWRAARTPVTAGASSGCRSYVRHTATAEKSASVHAQNSSEPDGPPHSLGMAARQGAPSLRVAATPWPLKSFVRRA